MVCVCSVRLPLGCARALLCVALFIWYVAYLFIFPFSLDCGSIFSFSFWLFLGGTSAKWGCRFSEAAPGEGRLGCKLHSKCSKCFKLQRLRVVPLWASACPRDATAQTARECRVDPPHSSAMCIARVHRMADLAARSASAGFTSTVKYSSAAHRTGHCSPATHVPRGATQRSGRRARTAG